MIFKCTPCNMTFNSAEEFMSHKMNHQKGQDNIPEKKRGVLCLKCGKPISVDPSKENYSGEIVCGNCGQKLKVSLQDGEVIFVSTKSEQA